MLNWNGREDTLTCLASLRAIIGDPPKLICVDNASSDGSAEAILERFPDVELIEAAGNLGFAGGNNRGISRALELGAEWVVLVNNDATVAPDVIDAFRESARRFPQAGVLAGKVYYREPPDRVWFAGQRVFPKLGYSGRARGWKRRDRRRYARPIETGRAAGALMAVSAAAAEAAGLMDEGLFLYVEDVDWSLRIRRAGFKIRFVPDAKAWHRVAASTGGEKDSVDYLYYATRNTIAVCESNEPMPLVLTRLRRLVIAASFAAHGLTKPNRQSALAAVADGYDDGCAGRLGRRPSAVS